MSVDVLNVRPPSLSLWSPDIKRLLPQETFPFVPIPPVTYSLLDWLESAIVPIATLFVPRSICKAVPSAASAP